MYEREFKYVYKMFYLMGMHPLQKLHIPLIMFNFVLTLYVTILIVLRAILTRDLVVMESIGVFAQIWLKFIILTTKRKQIKQILNDTQKFWKDEIKGSENNMFLRMLNKGMNIFLIYIFCSTCMFLFKPLLNSGTTIYYYYKISQIPFFVSYAIEFYVTVVTMLMVISCNTMISILIVIGAGQFSNLNAKMRQLNLETIQNDIDLKVCLRKLNLNIKYHNFLMTYVKRIDNVFSVLFVLLMAIVTSLLCMNMYVLSSPNTTYVDMIRCSTMVCALTSEFLLLYGVPSQTLMDEAAELSDTAFYHCQWYLPKIIPARKALMMVINRSQKPVCLSAAGFIDINKQTIVSMLKTAYSFFTFLQTVVDGPH